MQACKSLDVDLIYLDLSSPLAFKLFIKDLQAAIQRGVHFEVDYRPAIQQSVGLTSYFAAAQSK